MFFYPNRIVIYSAWGRFAKGGEEVDKDSQKLPLLTFPKLLLAQKKIPMSCHSAAGSSVQILAALSISILYFDADERPAFQEERSTPSLSQEINYFIFG